MKVKSQNSKVNPFDKLRIDTERSRSIKNTSQKLKVRNIFLLLTLFIVSYWLFKNISSSVFLKEKDRVNVVFYSQNSKFFSLSKKEVNYLVKFPAEIEILVPGGYGKYRVGALGKLVALEKNPDLLKKTFSGVTSTLVDLYFYPRKTEIYYNIFDDSNFPTIGQIFFCRSNANMVDRLFLLFKFFDKNSANYKIISLNKALFNQEQFHKDFQGSFYKKTYREIGENVQIIYTRSYSTAMLLSQMIDGEGIRVVDLSQGKNIDKNCQVIIKKSSLISQDIARYFNCQVRIGETTVSDIILELGDLEKEWAVK